VRARNVAIAAAIALVLTGACFLIPPSPLYPDEADPNPGPTLPATTTVEYVPVEGKLVTCIFRSSQGVSCDWANARPLDVGTTTHRVPQTNQPG
jgi:hypothetical protein